MDYFDSEELNLLEVAFRSDSTCLPHCPKAHWNCLMVEAQSAIRVTLEELALLAGIVTAETVTHTSAHLPLSSSPSAYSLLIEPAFFKFPS